MKITIRNVEWKSANNSISMSTISTTLSEHLKKPA